MFHAVRSLLALDGKDFKSHSQVLGYFNKMYIHSGIIDNHFNGTLQDASKSRNNSDYDDYYKATIEEAEKNINDAKSFLKEVERVIEVRLEAETIDGVATPSDDEPTTNWRG